jgi:hypothetical protein
MKGIIAIAALVVALAATSAAVATPPSTQTFSGDYGPATENCGGFVLEFWGSVDVRETAYVDQQGNATRIAAHVQLTETDRNTSTGKSIQVRAAFTDVFDFVSGTETINGQVFMANDPGSGAVLQDTGKIVFNSDGSVVIHGPHEVFDSQSGIFCDALD